jgi:hypothetical protein
MKTGMTRLGRRTPGRTLAVPALPYRRLAARGGQSVAIARVRAARPDIIEPILPDHERIPRLLGKDDDPESYGEDPAWTWCSRTLAAVAGRIPGASSPGRPADQRPARSGQARGADPDTGAYAFGHRRVVADVAAAVLARRFRFDEETTGSGRRSCENCDGA